MQKFKVLFFTSALILSASTAANEPLKKVDGSSKERPGMQVDVAPSKVSGNDGLPPNPEVLPDINVLKRWVDISRDLESKAKHTKGLPSVTEQKKTQWFDRAVYVYLGRADGKDKGVISIGGNRFTLTTGDVFMGNIIDSITADSVKMKAGKKIISIATFNGEDANTAPGSITSISGIMPAPPISVRN